MDGESDNEANWLGTKNASSSVCLVEFEEEYGKMKVVNKRLWGRFSLKERFQWMEYIPRLGWLPDGKRFGSPSFSKGKLIVLNGLNNNLNHQQSVWALILDRTQTQQALIQIPLTDFMTEEEYLSKEKGFDLDTESNWDFLFLETSDVWLTVSFLSTKFSSFWKLYHLSISR